MKKFFFLSKRQEEKIVRKKFEPGPERSKGRKRKNSVKKKEKEEKRSQIANIFILENFLEERKRSKKIKEKKNISQIDGGGKIV